ncbi:MAG: DUF4912 domain-containing protein [Cyanobacteria bacterium P01_D01_bin.2]
MIKFAALALAAATVSQVSGAHFSRHALAQSFGETPETFPIPGSLPDGTTLKVDGSTSMRFTNEDLKDRFEEQYANVDIELDASRTDRAFEALIEGDIDLLATGRPLTDDEKAQGVVEVPLEQREKLAIIVGPDNSFEGDLTFEQFARIFRGEITNWSEVGGEDLAIRLVDRPDYSDTRRALSTYAVFEDKPFATSTTADPVADDETDSVVTALGNDGIGYAVVSQVSERNDARIIPMHQTLPDDPRYPYSQYRAFVYKEGAGAAALAFLGFATTEPGQEVLETEAVTAAPATTSDADAPDIANDAPGTDIDPGTDSAPATAAGDSPTTATAPAESSAPVEAIDPAADPAAGAAAGAATAGKGGFPFWLLPLLAIPLLGALLWWLLKGGGAAAGGAAAASGTTAPAAAAPVAAAQPRLVLTPRDCRNAYAYWEIPQARLTEIKRQGGDTMMVRLYDVTGRSKNTPLPSATAEFPCIESNPDLHFPIAVDDRSYCAEVGYLSADNQWLPIAKSEQVRVPVCPKEIPKETPAAAVPAAASPKGPAAALGGAALGGAALAGAAALGATKLASGKAAAPAEPGRMVLTPLNSQDAYAYWEIPQGQLAQAKQQGDGTMVARLYDVTDRPAEAVLPEPTAQVNCTDADVDTHFSVAPGRDYISEIGYQTASGSWLPVAQSKSVRVPTAAGTIPGAAILGGAAAIAAGAAAMGSGVGNTNAVDNSAAQSRIVLTPQSSQKAYAYWEVPATAQSALKAEGGQNYQLRIHDVTDVDINRQSPNSTLSYDLSDSDCDRTVPLPEAQRDYLAEVGYKTESGDWLMLARSAPVKPATGLTEAASEPIDKGAVAGIAVAGAAGVMAAAGRPVIPDTAEASAQGSVQTVQVHSRNNAVMFTEEQLRHIEHDVASTHKLVPGVYTLQLRDGVFNYDRDDAHPGEPFVLLWIHGGTVINQKTGVPVSSTWTTLNGYNDTLILNVREPATLCAFFVDTYPDDNSGEVTLSVTKQ